MNLNEARKGDKVRFRDGTTGRYSEKLGNTDWHLVARPDGGNHTVLDNGQWTPEKLDGWDVVELQPDIYRELREAIAALSAALVRLEQQR